MTLQFKFPSHQTNLLALDRTLYKIKILYDEESAERNQRMNNPALAEIIRDELEEAVRVLCLMFMKEAELKRVKSCHFIFSAIRKPWKTAKKLKFRCNGETLNVCEDVLEITVTTRVTPSVLFNNSLQPQVLIDNSSASLMNESAEAEPNKKSAKKKSSKSSPKRKRPSKASAGSPSKKFKNQNTNSSVLPEDDHLQVPSNGPCTRGMVRSSKNVPTNESDRVEKQEKQKCSPSKGRYLLRKSHNANNSNNSCPSSDKTKLVDHVGNPTSTDKALDSSSRHVRSRGPLLQKSRLDQFVVEEEERDEELKLQQLTQPSKSPQSSPGYLKRSAPPRRRPARRSSLVGAAVDMILTPFKYFTRKRITSS